MNKADLSRLPPEGRVVIGFSGGADSTALAHWAKGQLGPVRILLAHVNHCLRGAESDRDERAVRAFAKGQGLALTVYRADVAKLAKEQGLGLEECGRRVRYAFFDSLAPGENDRILTAHHAGDNAETLLLHLCRGASLQGLCGIPPQRGKVLRPLLQVGREEIEAYCAQEELPYVTDSTNACTDYARNRLRHEVIPLLRQLNPRFLEATGQTMALLSADRDYLEGRAGELLKGAKGAFGLDRRALRDAPESLRSRALKRYLEGAGCENLEKKHLDLADQLLETGGGLSLPGGVQARCALGWFYAGKPEDVKVFSLPVGLGQTPLPGGKGLVLEKKDWPKSENRPKIQNLLFKNALDYATIYGTGQDVNGSYLIARTRRPGDTFTPPGQKHPLPLKQALREAGVPAWARPGLVLLELDGRIAFCEGLGPAEGFQPGAGRLLAVGIEKTMELGKADTRNGKEER